MISETRTEICAVATGGGHAVLGTGGPPLPVLVFASDWETWAPYKERIRPSMQREEPRAKATGLAAFTLLLKSTKVSVGQSCCRMSSRATISPGCSRSTTKICKAAPGVSIERPAGERPGSIEFEDAKLHNSVLCGCGHTTAYATHTSVVHCQGKRLANNVSPGCNHLRV